ncbi:MAG: DUF4386 family protein [Eubacteriales bacterium]
MMIGNAVPDAGTSVLTAANRTPLMIGILLELVNVLSVLGIGSILASALRPGSDRVATGYAVLRTVEAVFCAVAQPLARWRCSTPLDRKRDSPVRFLRCAQG